MELYESNPELFKEIFNLAVVASRILENNQLGAYTITRDDESKGYLFRNDSYYWYSVPSIKDSITFKLNEDNTIDYMIYHDYIVLFEPYLRIVKDNIEYTLDIHYCPTGEYNGLVLYEQKNLVTNEKCELGYNHMYYNNCNKAPIYKIRLEEMASFSIENNNERFLYTIVVADYGTKEYDAIAIREFGLGKYAENGSLNLIGNNTVKRYYKNDGVIGNNVFTFLLKKGLLYEDICKLIKENNFRSDVPSELVDIYNEEVEIIKDVFSLLNLVNEVDKNNDNNKRLVITLKED